MIWTWGMFDKVLGDAQVICRLLLEIDILKVLQFPKFEIEVNFGDIRPLQVFQTWVQVCIIISVLCLRFDSIPSYLSTIHYIRSQLLEDKSFCLSILSFLTTLCIIYPSTGTFHTTCKICFKEDAPAKYCST